MCGIWLRLVLVGATVTCRPAAPPPSGRACAKRPFTRLLSQKVTLTCAALGAVQVLSLTPFRVSNVMTVGVP